MNKKGFVLAGLSIGMIVVLSVLALFIVIAVLVFTSINIYAVIGAVAIILTLVFGLRGNMNKTKAYFMAFVIIGGLIFVFVGQITQTITGVSTYTDNQGDVHWLINGVANNVDEGYTFRSLPNPVSISGGKEIKPKEEAVLYISKKESYCKYTLNKVTRTKRILLIPVTITYYELLSPERVAKISVRDDSGSTKVLDGTTTRATKFYDNNGELEFTTLGTLGSKRDCVDGDNVAIIFGDNTLIKQKSDLDNKWNALSSSPVSLFNFLSVEVRDNTQFLSNFDDYDILGTSEFRGDVDIGNVEFTIDADQDYYNSFVYTPPKEIKPRIDRVDISDEIKTDSTTSAKITISNREDSKGTISIDASVDSGSVSPESKNVILEDKVTETFIIKAPNSESRGKICFEVCSVSSPINCDSDCESYDIVSDAEETCGDGICQSFESYTSCPADCKKDSGGDGGDVDCKWYEEEVPGGTIEDCGILNWRKSVGMCKTITYDASCKISTGVYIIAFILAFVIFITAFVLSNKKRRKRRR